MQNARDEATPGEAEFLSAPRAVVAKVAPAAMVYAPAGTRRQAVLAGLDSASDAYVAWSRNQMTAAFQLIFAYGVQHLFTVLAAPGQFAEVGRYRDRLLAWIEWGLTGPEATADFVRLGWGVRLLADASPAMNAIRHKLAQLPQPATAPTLWFLVAPDEEEPWHWLFDAVLRTGARTRPEAIQALYGSDVPPVTLYLSFGKPTYASYLLPPLLTGLVQCYWTQRPGYALTDLEWRRILYDYAYLRPTWLADKTGRAEQILADRTLWERGPILGLGTRVGPFWYPAAPDLSSTSPESNAGKRG